MQQLRNGSCPAGLVLTCCWGCGLALHQGLPGSGLPGSVLCSRPHSPLMPGSQLVKALEMLLSHGSVLGGGDAMSPLAPQAPLIPPCLCLSADFDRAEVRQPKAEG